MLLSENLDVVVLVSGDGDFVRLVDAIQMRGVRCEVIGFGISTSNELIEAADQFTEIGSLPGIFRNAPSGPGVHLRAPQGAPDQRGVYTYSAVSYSATYALPGEHLSGERERERLRAIQGERLTSPSFWQDREQRQQPQVEQNGHILESGSEANGQSLGYDFATHDEFMLPDAEACGDHHSIPSPACTLLLGQTPTMSSSPRCPRARCSITRNTRHHVSTLRSVGPCRYRGPGRFAPILALGRVQAPFRLDPRRLALPSPGQSSGEAILAQILFRAVPRLPLPVSIAYIPRGPLLAPGSDPSVEAPFWRTVHSVARKQGAIFLKVEPPVEIASPEQKADLDHLMQSLGFQSAGRLQPARTMVLDIDKSEEDLLAAMKTKTRYNIRLAGRRGVIVRQARTLEDLHAFHSLLTVTGDRDEFGIHTFPYYQQMWRTFGPEGDNTALVLLADHPDEAARSNGPIAALLALRFGREAIYMYGASSNTGREHMPNYLLQWEAIKWARSNNCTIYDFWGIPDAPAEDSAEAESSPTNTRSGLRGVYWFKKGFGGREIEYPGAYDYVYNPLLYKLWLRWRGSDLG